MKYVKYQLNNNVACRQIATQLLFNESIILSILFVLFQVPKFEVINTELLITNTRKAGLVIKEGHTTLNHLQTIWIFSCLITTLTTTTVLLLYLIRATQK